MASDETRLERIADTEGGERLANEHIVKARRDGDSFKVRCECGDPLCHDPLELSEELYERVRSDSMLFVVAPGHELPEAENVVETQDGYEIVRKHEEMRAVVERSDPRT